MEHAERDKEWTEDDHRKQSCWKLEEQRNRRESYSICAGNDQRKGDVKIDVAHTVWPWISE